MPTTAIALGSVGSGECDADGAGSVVDGAPPLFAALADRGA